MSRRPITKFWKGPLAFIVVGLLAFGIFLQTGSYFVGIAVLLFAAVVYAVYATGESSDLPGTTGKNDKNIPT